MRVLNLDYIQGASNKICRNIQSLEAFISSKYIGAYFPLCTEPQISGLIESMAASGKRVFIPVINGDSLLFSKYSKGMEMKKNSFGTLEPVHRNYSENLDIVLVPGLAFDSLGNRLGRGKGYYDHYLAGSNAMKIGLCFDFQLFPSIPHRQQDIKMDVIVSDDRIIFVSGKR